MGDQRSLKLCKSGILTGPLQKGVIVLLTPGVGYCKCKCRCQAVNVKLGQMCPRYQMWKYDLGQVVVSHSPENGLSSWVLQLLRDMRMKREEMKERERE